MKIAVNTRLLIKDKLEGIGWFTFETLKRITTSHPEHEFVFFFDRAYDQSFIFADNITPVVLSPQARHPVLFRWWFNRSVTRALAKYKVDLFLSPDGFLSLHTSVPQLAVIHDLNFEHYPKDLPKAHSNYYRHFFPLFAKKAKRIATVSNYSKQDIADAYGVKGDLIDVVYNGVNDRYRPIASDEIHAFRSQFSADEPYFIYVGSFHPRKNLLRLLKAYDRFCESHEGTVKLMLVGEYMWKDKDMQKTLAEMNFPENVIFMGRLTPDDLNRAIASSLAMVYVPYFEGFGIPILEGFKCGVPVMTSNITSMPEVAGNAALLVDPFNINTIAEGMKSLAENVDLRNGLVEKGNIRVKDFSWDQTAEALWKCIQKALS